MSAMYEESTTISDTVTISFATQFSVYGCQVAMSALSVTFQFTKSKYTLHPLG